ncbi:hypothetical protein B1U23_06510 (plasmid) [Borreliella burgdorferi]|uniref:Uncharacterized protein n=2 Tax=Borreliella burgdorferi TaxID=139 RepID=Q9RZZ3_BORBU|nr:DUF685 domain-containing protein [Borreliella burgdorferi]AAF07718.1 conserved hypothetical protein [Borreliella burgdorferi B31]ARS30998.1 hypothetical protein B1U23_06510 [Borreliella burgdorferi]ARS32256.1 hypothetical protein B1U22_06645 [Borreliella burgdorferi]ARS32740.1 hypothetical protein B1U21_02545 [Borreliella burgdorferi]PNL87321.1 DUF685 domain-containing protein [Borreliella burgdorferi]
MADDQEKLLIDEEETVQIKDLNKVTTVNDTDLLLLDNGAASSNAITFKNFLDASKDKIFKGEGLDYFKQIIKSTIAEELAADKDFVEKIYAKITDKLINNDSTNISNLFSKIKSRLTDSISSATLSKSDDLLIMPSSDTIQKTPVPKHILGVPSNFTYGSITRSTTLYPSDYENKAISINMEDNDDVTLIFYKNYDNDPIYLDIEIQVKINDNRMQKKSLKLMYSDEITYNWVYEITGPRGLFTRTPIYNGWYIQKRAYMYGDSVPDLLKL